MHKALIRCAMIYEINQKGDIVRSLMDLKGEKFAFPSEVEDDAGVLYIGSFREPYVIRLDTYRLKKN